jgi:hypothetical protein
MVLNIVRETNQLHPLIGIGDGNKDRFIEAAANHFHLAAFHQRFQALKVFGTILFDPGKQRAGIVEAHVDARVFLESFNERQVTAGIGLFKDMPKIAARLMGVDEQD